ncbi:hypothetical protein [Vulcanisaeta thermophila]|uniref:hypothetical protein n=1 Tax=Vulcanisaeta thermophila TaxID=867917 RepID=UPI000852A7B7|nr:hypothetical protein [Vulcanisaeta thermophila]
MITVFLMPMRIEYLRYFKEASRNFDVLIPELAGSMGVIKFINNDGELDDALLDVEIHDYKFMRKFLELLRDMSREGKRVIPLDPYGEYSMAIRSKYLLNKLSMGSLSDVQKYIAYMEIHMANIMREYSLAWSRHDFDKLVNLTIKYARADSGRIRFRSELRARSISKLLEEYGDANVMVQADYFNSVLIKYLQQRLNAEVRVIEAVSEASKRLGILLNPQPGYLLTMNYLNGKAMDPIEERLLAARSVAYVSLRPRLVRLAGSNPDLLMVMENSLIGLLNTLDYDGCKSLFYRNQFKDLFKIKA